MNKSIVKKVIGLVPYGIVRQTLMASASQAVMRKAGLQGNLRPPLRTIYLQTRSLCNNTCSFCAASITFQQRHGTRQDVLMDCTTHMRIMADLGEMGFAGRIGYHFNNEPLLDKRLVDFVCCARSFCPGAEIDVMTNGIILSAAIGRQLFEAGLNLLRINNYSDAGKWLPNVREFMDKVTGKVPQEGERVMTAHVSYNHRQTVILNMRRLTESLQNRAGSSPSGENVHKSLRCNCLFPSNHMAVGATGEVGLCCSDFYISEVMGDLSRQGVLEVWHGDRFRQYRKHLAQGRRELITLCGQCDYPGF